MSQPIRVLIVEDSIYCTDLNVRELRRGGFDVSWKRVVSEEEMREALGSESWDIILSDNATPHFNAIQALTVKQSVAPRVPLIIVSDDLTPENIRYAMRKGCCAYLLKENLHQLAIIVRNIVNRFNP